MLWINRLRWQLTIATRRSRVCCWSTSIQHLSDISASRERVPNVTAEVSISQPIEPRSTAPVVIKNKNVPYYGAGVTRQPVPLSASTVSWKPPEQPEDARIVRVALVGLPNAGKSSFLNALIESPIAAVSPKVNTTREDIKGILCVDNCQIIISDCPGILESHRRRKFCGQLVSTAWKAYDEADACLFIIDVVKRPDASLFKIIRSLAGAPLCPQKIDVNQDESASPLHYDTVGNESLEDNHTDNSDDIEIEEALYDEELETNHNKTRRKPVGLVLNKIDLAEHKKWVKARTRELKNHGTFDDIFYTSSKYGIGLSPILEFLKSVSRPGMWVYPLDMMTTMSKVQIVEQMVRTYTYCWFNKELPYRVGQSVIGWTVAENGSLIIEMELYVRNDKAAKIICGIQGRVVKQMQKNVSHRLSKLWNEPVFLYIQVKVR